MFLLSTGPNPLVSVLLALTSSRCRMSNFQKEYLKEPTEEFKAMEARQSDFAAAQRAYKQEFVKKLDVSMTDVVQEIQ